jgi:hypothetical protein
MDGFDFLCGLLSVAPLMAVPVWLATRSVSIGPLSRAWQSAATHLTLKQVTSVAWMLVGFSILAMTTLPLGYLCCLVGLPAAPVAVVGSLLMLLRRLTQPEAGLAADYDDAKAADPDDGRHAG